MSGRRILLIVGGGIAAYKACELIRALRRDGCTVRCVLTDGGARFVTAMTLAALSEQPVHTSLWDLKEEAEMGHIRLSREADLVVVCPATADLLARMAAGTADDLATTLLLATDTPVLAAPAMNVRMWLHAATVRNVARLRADGVTVLEPDEGAMACGEYGPGRLPEVERIAAAVQAALKPSSPRGSEGDRSAGGTSQPRSWLGEGEPPSTDTLPTASDRPLSPTLPEGERELAGTRAIVTAGPTHEPIDPVRYIANRSSGRQGFAIAAALARAGAEVTLVAGPVALATPAGVARVDVETAREMAAAVEAALPADVAVLVAAVADWRVEPAGHKIKKGADAAPTLALRENPDILATLARDPRRPRLLVGFAAETEHVVAHAVAKRARKGCDWIVANDVAGEVMGGARNRVHLVTADGVEDWPEAAKEEVAARLAARVAAALRDA